MTVVTQEDLTKAMANIIEANPEAVADDAGYIMDLFGYEDRIIDNVLEPEDRQLFYLMEEADLVAPEREETTIYDGRRWRTHYWRLEKENILEYASLGDEEVGEEEGEKEGVEEKGEGGIYGDIPDKLWSDHG